MQLDTLGHPAFTVHTSNKNRIKNFLSDLGVAYLMFMLVSIALILCPSFQYKILNKICLLVCHGKNLCERPDRQNFDHFPSAILDYRANFEQHVPARRIQLLKIEGLTFRLISFVLLLDI